MKTIIPDAQLTDKQLAQRKKNRARRHERAAYKTMESRYLSLILARVKKGFQRDFEPALAPGMEAAAACYGSRPAAGQQQASSSRPRPKAEKDSNGNA